MPLKQSIRKYASCINRLSESFLPSAFDQHLAVLSEGYEYQFLDITGELGSDRFLCRNAEGEQFIVWSHSIAINRVEGNTTILTALIHLEGGSDAPETDGGYVPAITYGPVLGWKTLFAADFTRLARALGRDLLKLKGVSAVVRRDPVPFWALWSLSEIPPVLHNGEEFCTCWNEGRFSTDPAPLLAGTAWKRSSVGKRIRFLKSGPKPFFEQQVIYDGKTMRGVILARRGSYLAKLSALVGNVFTPDPDGDGYATPAFEMALSEILRVQPAYRSWTAPFEREDDRKIAVRDERHPERKAELESFNAAMQDLLPFVNSGTVPDWGSLASKHSLDGQNLEALKGLFAEIVKKRP